MPLQIKADSVVTIMGVRGSGKSTVARRLARDWPAKLVYIFDPLDEYEELVDVTAYDIVGVIDAFEAGAKRVRYCRGCISDAAELLTYIRELDDILIVHDEADMLFEAGRACNPEAIRWITDYGRHCNMGLIAIARRPSSLPRDMTAQSILIFRPAAEPRDAAYLNARLGFDPEPLPGEFDWYAHDLAGDLHVLPGAWAIN